MRRPQTALKRNIQRQLNLPRFVQRAGDLPRSWRIYLRIRKRKLRRVEQVEYFAAQLKRGLLSEFEVFEDREVRVVKSRATQTSAASGAEHAGQRPARIRGLAGG